MRKLAMKALIAACCLTLPLAVSASETIDFEGLAAGTIVSSVSSAGGAGPVTVHGSLPSAPGENRALIFDSGNPTGGDFDLGAPNVTCPGGGPGMGVAGQFMMPNENCEPLGNILILGEDLDDDNPADGLVDDPDDADEIGAMITLDFSALGAVSMESITLLDVEADEPNAEIHLLDAGDGLIAMFVLDSTGNNGRIDVGLGPTPGVYKMVVTLNGSGSIDNIVFTPEIIDCGDGNVDPPLEQCDPPGDPVPPLNNECRDDCTYCGDGILQSPPENCEPGDNAGLPNACRDDCTFCGDDTRDPGEDCDDGNNDPGDGCSPTCEDEEGPEGCTPGQWKTDPNDGLWGPTGWAPGDALSAAFSNSTLYFANSTTLLDALQFGGGSGEIGAARNLLRAAVAGLLNASHPDIDYAGLSAAALVNQVNAALASGDRATMILLGESIDDDNNADCPLNAAGEVEGNAAGTEAPEAAVEEHRFRLPGTTGATGTTVDLGLRK